MSKLFSDIRGQKRTVKILESHILSNNLSHAYLFFGADGLGKTYLARELARYILCNNSKEDNCDSCKRTLKGTHPDLLEISGKYRIKIDQVRGLIERINLTPVLSRKKVLLISDIQNIGIEAANALLKTIEEPPSDSVVVMTSNSEERLLKTIISRSQVFRLNPIQKDDMFFYLNEFKLSEDAKKDIINLSGGNIAELQKIAKDFSYMKRKKEEIEDAKILFTSDSILERFVIIEKYEKTKETMVLFNNFSKLFFLNLKKEIPSDDVIDIWYLDIDWPIGVQRVIGQKILKIYDDLNYNVNLRISLEEIILQKDFLCQN